MDITRDVTYRGLKLTGAAVPDGGGPIQGYRLTRARYSQASVHGYVEKKSLDDGMDVSDVFLGMRSVDLSGEVYARRKGELFDMLDLLRLKFTPTDAYNESSEQKGYLPLSFSQPTLLTDFWPTGFIDRVVYVRPAEPATFEIAFNAIGGLGGSDDKGYVVPFSVSLQAKDPRFYNPIISTKALTGTSGNEGTGVINRGNYPAPLDFLLIIPASQANGSTFHFAGLGTTMDVVIPGGSFQRTVRVDGRQKVCTLTTNGVETLRMDLVTFDAEMTWAKVKPTPDGAPVLGYDWTCTHSLAAGSDLFFQEAWV